VVLLLIAEAAVADNQVIKDLFMAVELAAVELAAIKILMELMELTL
jgi:hypothetical protein